MFRAPQFYFTLYLNMSIYLSAWVFVHVCLQTYVTLWMLYWNTILDCGVIDFAAHIFHIGFGVRLTQHQFVHFMHSRRWYHLTVHQKLILHKIHYGLNEMLYCKHVLHCPQNTHTHAHIYRHKYKVTSKELTEYQIKK